MYFVFSVIKIYNSVTQFYSIYWAFNCFFLASNPPFYANKIARIFLSTHRKLQAQLTRLLARQKFARRRAATKIPFSTIKRTRKSSARCRRGDCKLASQALPCLPAVFPGELTAELSKSSRERSRSDKSRSTGHGANASRRVVVLWRHRELCGPYRACSHRHHWWRRVGGEEDRWERWASWRHTW